MAASVVVQKANIFDQDILSRAKQKSMVKRSKRKPKSKNTNFATVEKPMDKTTYSNIESISVSLIRSGINTYRSKSSTIRTKKNRSKFKGKCHINYLFMFYICL